MSGDECTCEKCGAVLRLGSFPFCPHEPAKMSIIGDDIPGGMVVENGFDTPQKFYSHSEHRAALAARGLEIRAKWAGPHDKIMSRWDAPDAYTLDAAAQLVTRTKQPKGDIPIAVTTLADRFRVEADA